MRLRKKRARSEEKLIRTIFVSYTFTNGNTCLLVGILQNHDLRQLNA